VTPGRPAGPSGPPTALGEARAQRRRPGTELGPRATRTIAKILDATRQILLVKGYGGTTVDEVMREAGVSRGSFYTYFHSKRDALLALGATTLRAGHEAVDALGELPAAWTVDDLETWVGHYFEQLDEHGSFAFAWTQAANDDEAIRQAGMAAHLRLCERAGVALAALGGWSVAHPREFGLAVFAMLERAWVYSALYTGQLERSGLVHSTAELLAAVVADPGDD